MAFDKLRSLIQEVSLSSQRQMPVTGFSQTQPGYSTSFSGNVLPFNGAVPYYMFYDDETANTDQRICQIAYILTDQNGRQIAPSYSQLIQPSSPFSWQCTSIHGITAEHVVGMPTLSQYCSSGMFMWLLQNCILVAHGAKTADLSHINKSLKAEGIEVPDIRYIDTVDMAKKLGFQVTTLESLCQFYQIPLAQHHDALSDAFACYQLFGRLIQAGALAKPRKWQPPERRNKKKNQSSSNNNNAENTNTAWSRKSVTAIENNLVYGSDRTIDSVIDEFQKAGLLRQAREIRSIHGLGICISGAVPGYTKEEAKKITETLGGIVKTGMSSKVQLLVLGAGAGPKKIEYALEKKVPAISAIEYKRAISTILAQRSMRIKLGKH